MLGQLVLGDWDAVSAWINAGGSECLNDTSYMLNTYQGYTALQIACIRKAPLYIFQAILKNENVTSLTINYKDHKGNTPLTLLQQGDIFKGSGTYSNTISKTELELIKQFLIEKGAKEIKKQTFTYEEKSCIYCISFYFLIDWILHLF